MSDKFDWAKVTESNISKHIIKIRQIINNDLDNEVNIPKDKLILILDYLLDPNHVANVSIIAAILTRLQFDNNTMLTLFRKCVKAGFSRISGLLLIALGNEETILSNLDYLLKHKKMKLDLVLGFLFPTNFGVPLKHYYETCVGDRLGTYSSKFKQQILDICAENNCVDTLQSIMPNIDVEDVASLIKVVHKSVKLAQICLTHLEVPVILKLMEYDKFIEVLGNPEVACALLLYNKKLARLKNEMPLSFLETLIKNGVGYPGVYHSLFADSGPVALQLLRKILDGTVKWTHKLPVYTYYKKENYVSSEEDYSEDEEKDYSEDEEKDYSEDLDDEEDGYVNASSYYGKPELSTLNLVRIILNSTASINIPPKDLKRVVEFTISSPEKDAIKNSVLYFVINYHALSCDTTTIKSIVDAGKSIHLDTIIVKSLLQHKMTTPAMVEELVGKGLPPPDTKVEETILSNLNDSAKVKISLDKPKEEEPSSEHVSWFDYNDEDEMDELDEGNYSTKGLPFQYPYATILRRLVHDPKISEDTKSKLRDYYEEYKLGKSKNVTTKDTKEYASFGTMLSTTKDRSRLSRAVPKIKTLDSFGKLWLNSYATLSMLKSVFERLQGKIAEDPQKFKSLLDITVNKYYVYSPLRRCLGFYLTDLMELNPFFRLNLMFLLKIAKFDDNGMKFVKYCQDSGLKFKTSIMRQLLNAAVSAVEYENDEHDLPESLIESTYQLWTIDFNKDGAIEIYNLVKYFLNLPSVSTKFLKLMLKDFESLLSKTKKKSMLEPSIELITNKLRTKRDQTSTTSKVIEHKLLSNEVTNKLETSLQSLLRDFEGKEQVAWGLVNKYFSVPQLPKLAQKKLTELKSVQGTVNIEKLKSTINYLSSTVPLYNLGLTSYSGLQTMHESKNTTVIQLNITEEFNKLLAEDLSPTEVQLWQEYHNILTDEEGGHPVKNKKTIAWVRITTFPERKTLIVEELQSDILNEKSIDNRVSRAYAKLKRGHDYIDAKDRSRFHKFVEKLMGLWEVSALAAVKYYAETQGYNHIYMVPAHVKAKNSGRSKYKEGNDPALEQIYDKVPPMVGFTKIDTQDINDKLLKNAVLNSQGTYIWYTELKNLRVASKRARLANVVRTMKIILFK